MNQATDPQPGDLYAACDDDGRWSLVLRFVRLVRSGVGEFRDDRGDGFTIPLDKLTRLGTAAHDDGPDPAEAMDERLYRRRSRVTAQQRANRRITPAQRRALFALANRAGLRVDDVRAMTPLGSISKLTVREAAALIDRLNGRSATPARGAQNVG